MMGGDSRELLYHSIDDDSITKHKVRGLDLPHGHGDNEEMLIRFSTLTADYRYLIIVALFDADDECKDRMYVMDLKSGTFEFQRCDIDIFSAFPFIRYAISCKWNATETATMIGGYIRETYESKNENGRIIPTEIHNVIADYLSVQELLHVINFDKEHFALSIDDILLARLD